MSASHPVWTEHYKITSYLVNLRKQAGLYSVLNFIQDVGWQHSFKLGVQLPAHQGWVFTRQKLKMDMWPKWNESLSITTWIRKPEGAFIYRDYELYSNDKKIGEATSSFTVMDMNTRKLALQDWSTLPPFWKEDGTYDTKPEKIPFIENAKVISEFEVRNSDIDLNEHVNNTKYAQWILDSLNIDLLKGGIYLKGYEVNFLSEMKLGNKVSVHQAESDKPGCIQFQGLRTNDQKPVFTAQLIVEDQP